MSKQTPLRARRRRQAVDEDTLEFIEDEGRRRMRTSFRADPLDQVPDNPGAITSNDLSKDDGGNLVLRRKP